MIENHLKTNSMNFYEKFKEFSNVELLKILHEREKYQHMAIEAVESILKDRVISEEERQEVHDYFEFESKKHESTIKTFNTIKQYFIDVSDVFTQNSNELDLNKWLKAIFFIYTIQFLDPLFDLAKLFYESNNFIEDISNIQGLIYLAKLLVIALMFYLLYKRSIVGWTIIFCYAFLNFFSSVPSMILYYKYMNANGADTNPILDLLLVFYRGTTVLFLWKSEVTEFFNVSEKTKWIILKSTAVVTGIICIWVTYSALKIKI